MSKSKKYISAEEYFNDQPVNTRDALFKLKKCILAVVPEATELINYIHTSLCIDKKRKKRATDNDCGIQKSMLAYIRIPL